MAKLLYKSNEIFEGIASYRDAKYTDDELKNLKEEIYDFEKKLEDKYVPYSSEYCYELGVKLEKKLKQYSVIESERYKFWKMLREYVNIRDNKKVITVKRDPYEYCYLLSKLDRELVVKFSRTKWDHLFDCVTAREDKRIYDWLLKENNQYLLGTVECWREFIKGVKVYFKKLDSTVFADDEISNIYTDILCKAIFLIKYAKENGKLSSRKRDMYFFNTKNIKCSDEKKLQEILDNIVLSD